MKVEQTLFLSPSFTLFEWIKYHPGKQLPQKFLYFFSLKAYTALLTSKSKNKAVHWKEAGLRKRLNLLINNVVFMKSFSDILPRGKHIDASFPLFAKVQLQVSRLCLTVFVDVDFTNGYFSSNVNHGARCWWSSLMELLNSLWIHNLSNRTSTSNAPTESHSRDSQRNYEEIEKSIPEFIIEIRRFLVGELIDFLQVPRLINVIHP